MFFSSRMSRQPTPEANTATNPNTSNGNGSPVSADSSPLDHRGDVSEQPSSSHSPHRMSKDSEGYPSWLPKRPPPPAPASTFHSSTGGAHDPSPVEPPPQFVGGRKPTPRSVRIVSLQEDFIAGAVAGNDHRTPADHIHRPNTSTGARAWSRASGAGISPTVFSSDPYASRIPQPRFHSRGLHLELLRNPSKLSRLYFYLWPLILFYHIPLQTYFDFNAVFILIQVSRFPNPQAPGVPGSGKNWALGAAAYVACWLVWILVVFIVYELIYSFVRRWRVKRPLMLPIYLSSPAFNYVALTSYVNFCFLQHIRFSAFFGENGSIRDGLAETFYFFSQNLPTVALLLPRAGLSFALLLSFSSPTAVDLAVIGSGQSIGRDGTFFRQDGSLSGYARGVLIANCAWTAWRILVLIISWIGLWVFSGQGCAGLCGPRYRWEEEDQEKSRYSVYSDVGDDQADSLPWSWRECSRLRIQDAYDFCLTTRPSLRWSHSKPLDGIGPTQDEMQQVLAAVLPSVPAPARRGALSEDLFEPKVHAKLATRLSDIIPKAIVSSMDKEAPSEGPLRELPYPFTKPGTGMVSSQDQVPFPASQDGSGSAQDSTSASPSGTTGSGSSGTEEEEEEDDDDEDEEEEEDEDGVDDDDDDDEAASPTSDERASGSMSSLGQPINSRYPFQFRRPGGGNGNGLGHGRGGSISSGAATSHGTQSMLSGSVMSQSTGNRPSTDSNSRSPSSRPRASLSQSSMSVAGIPGIPMPPRHPQQPRRRAGTVPAHVSGSSAGSAAAMAVEFPSVRRRTRADSGPGVPAAYQSGGAMFYDTTDEEEGVVPNEPAYVEDDPEPEGSEEAGEREDRVGLLGLVGSRTSLHHRGSRSRISLPSSSSGSASGSSRSRSNSRSRADSARSSVRSRANSVSISMRSRAHSLIQSVGVVSQTSLDMVRGAVGVRSRANSSMARLEEDVPYSSSSFEGRRGPVNRERIEAGYSSSNGTHSRSGSASANENYTFGQPMVFLGHLRQASEASRARSPSHLREEVESGNEIEEVLREADEPEEKDVQSTRQSTHSSPHLRPQVSDAQFTISEQMSSSALSVEFHSAQPSERTASPVEPPTPVPSQSPEHTSRAIPIPISSWPGPSRNEETSNASTSPPDMISTAAGSFVTAPITLEGATTESSGQRTLGRSSSWGEMAAAVGGPIVGGHIMMPGGGEREDPSGGAWRVQ